MKSHIFAGSMGRAGAICGLLKAEIESGRVQIDYGSWGRPIVIYGLTDEEARTLEALLQEAEQ